MFVCFCFSWERETEGVGEDKEKKRDIMSWTFDKIKGEFFVKFSIIASIFSMGEKEGKMEREGGRKGRRGERVRLQYFLFSFLFSTFFINSMKRVLVGGYFFAKRKKMRIIFLLKYYFKAGERE